jgi:hypothetical protein
MSKILKYGEYEDSLKIIVEFAKLLVDPINESKKRGSGKEIVKISEGEVSKILDGLWERLKFNMGLILTFGAGINAMYPIVVQLIQNSNLNVTLTNESIILITIAVLTITYLEESKSKSSAAEIICQLCGGEGTLTDSEVENLDDVYTKKEKCYHCDGKGSHGVVTKWDTSTMLEELRMKGIGNNIIEKLVNCFLAIRKFLGIIFRGISTILDFFGYTAILIPVMNAITAVIHNNFWTIENLPAIMGGNLFSFGIGLVAILAKMGLDKLAQKVQDFLGNKNIKVEPVDIKNKPDDFDEHEIINDNFRRGR